MFETRAHLSRTFQRAILVALAGVGCSTKGADAIARAGDDGGVDAGAADAAAPDAAKEARAPDPCDPVKVVPDPPDTCGVYYRYPCGLPPDLTVRGSCYFGVLDCQSLCPDVHYNCHAIDSYCSDAGPDAADDEGGTVIPDEAGAVVIDCSICAGSAGRVPSGLAPEVVRARSALGAYFARAARLEAASVIAFRRLHDELSAHGAPTELLVATREAERDEVRHTRAMARLARRHGARYSRPRVDPIAPRSLEEISLENAVEGCARETLGALLATWQAARATDPELASTLEAIAQDETRHAALSWSILRWSLTRLGPEVRARIETAWRATLAALTREAAGDPLSELVASTVALPSAVERATLASELRPLWSTLLAA